jgi:hypothetical protein
MLGLAISENSLTVSIVIASGRRPRLSVHPARVREGPQWVDSAHPQLTKK